MTYHQSDIVLVNFPLPNGFSRHPAIIISNSEVYESESSYIACMITSSKIRDNFSFELTDHILSTPLDKPSQIRCHLIALFNEKEIERKISKLKKTSLKSLIQKINDSVFT